MGLAGGERDFKVRSEELGVGHKVLHGRAMAEGNVETESNGPRGSSQFQELLQCVLFHSLHEELIVLGKGGKTWSPGCWCLVSVGLGPHPPRILPPPPSPWPIPHSTGPR